MSIDSIKGINQVKQVKGWDRGYDFWHFDGAGGGVGDGNGKNRVARGAGLLDNRPEPVTIQAAERSQSDRVIS